MSKETTKSTLSESPRQQFVDKVCVACKEHICNKGSCLADIGSVLDCKDILEFVSKYQDRAV